MTINTKSGTTRLCTFEFVKEYCSILNSKTRWNSLMIMLERFYKLKSSMKKSVIDLNLDINFTGADFEEINSLVTIAIKVKSLCRKYSLNNLTLKFKHK